MITSILITFREALDAALIVSIILAYLGKIDRRDLNKYLYLGAGGAILISILLGQAVLALYGGLQEGADKIFEGAASVTATAVLTYMILQMAKATSISIHDAERYLQDEPSEVLQIYKHVPSSLRSGTAWVWSA